MFETNSTSPGLELSNLDRYDCTFENVLEMETNINLSSQVERPVDQIKDDEDDGKDDTSDHVDQQPVFDLAAGGFFLCHRIRITVLVCRFVSKQRRETKTKACNKECFVGLKNARCRSVV